MNEDKTHSQPELENESIAPVKSEPLSVQPPENWETLPDRDKDRFRNKQVEAVTQWLKTISNSEIDFQPIPYRLPEKDSVPNNQIRVENKSPLVDVDIDQRALQILLKICGVTTEDIKQLKLQLSTAALAHRDLFGNPTGGSLVSDDKGNSNINIITSVPDDYANAANPDTLTGIKHVILQFTEEMVANSLAHELRHFIQIKTGMYQDISGSYSAKDHDDLSFEKDANDFGNALGNELARFIRIRNNPTLSGIATQTVGQENKMVKAGWAKSGEALVLMGDDSKLIALDLQRRNLLNGMGSIDISEASTYMRLLHDALQSEKIGYTEYRWLLNEAFTAASEVDLGLQIYFQAELDSLAALAT